MANLYSPQFDADTSEFAREGYECRRARLGYQAGCERLGVSLWELAPGAEGTPHYHYGNEELLFVVSGRPQLLAPTGWRELEEGEVASFPRGPRGLHALANRGGNPVRVLICSEMRGPDVLIYPERGIVGVLEELSSPERGGMAAWLPLDAALVQDEGERPDAAASPAATPRQANLLHPRYDAEQQRRGFTWRRARLGQQAGAERLGASLFELPPGEASFPFHYHLANEELLVVINGHPTLRTPVGERQLEEGEVVALPVGEAGAHQVINRGEAPVLVLIASEMIGPEVVVYPDSVKVAARERPPGSLDQGLFKVFREGDAVDYLEDEKPPESV